MPTIRKDVMLSEITEGRVKAEKAIHEAILALEWLGVSVSGIRLISDQKVGERLPRVVAVNVGVDL